MRNLPAGRTMGLPGGFPGRGAVPLELVGAAKIRQATADEPRNGMADRGIAVSYLSCSQWG
jgi:hypothetical protein